MKTEAFLVVHAKFSGVSIVQDLGTAFPQGLDEDRFECRLPWEDERVTLLLERLTAHGLKPSGLRPSSPGDYHLAIERTYSRSDFESAAYLTFSSKTLLLNAIRDLDGVLRVKSDKIKSGMDMASTTRPWIVVSDRVKGLIEREGLIRASFREIRLDAPGSGSVRRGRHDFWELTSDLILPPMAPPCKFIHARTGEEVAGDSDESFVFREGLGIPGFFFLPPEPHYAEADLRSIGPFDLALTFERISGGYLGGLPICSQRFHQFCVANRLSQKMYWTPVRLNADEGV